MGLGGQLDKVRLDFSMINDIEYYNGIIFQGFLDGLARQVLSGGQYDGMMAKLGKKADAIGFAIYLKELERLPEKSIRYDVDALVLYEPDVDVVRLCQAVESLRRQGLRAKASRKFSPVSYRAHGLPVSENLLEQDFYASGPNQKWAGDITYLRTDEGWLYLAVVIDLWSRAVIGWSMSPRMTAQLACDALQMALWRRKRPRNVIVHTDRGGQYCSADYQAQLKRHNLRGSMSAKGCCYDNACVESFFHSLKVECIHGEHFISREIMRATVFNYIECDYNRWRRHSWCGGLSPEQFENQNLA